MVFFYLITNKKSVLIYDIVPPNKIKQNPPMQRLRGMNKKARNKLAPVLLVALIIFQTITGIFLPVEISPTPPYLKIQETHAAGWYSTGGTWDYRKEITIDHTKVDMDLTNFAVLISVIDTNLADTDNSGHVVQSDGGDILFTNSDGDKLDHEIEKYTNTSGELVAWVEVDSLSSSVDTVLYIYYGSSVVGDQWDMNATWESSLKMVQHLQETPQGTVYDSTSNDNDSISNNADPTTSGQVDGAYDFTAANSDYIDCGNKSSLNFGTGDFTVGIWFKIPDNSNYFIATKHSTDWVKWWLINTRVDGKVQFDVEDNDYGLSAVGITIVNFNQWYYAIGVRKAETIYVYLDGELEDSATAIGVSDISSDGNLHIGSYIDGGYTNGAIDEVRVYNRALTLQEISTQYNNQNSPSTFYSVGSEEEGNTTPNIPTLISPSDGSYTTDNTPTLSANYSDPDAGDTGTTNYRISSSSLSDCIDTVGINIVASGTSSATSDEDEDTEWTHSSSIGIDRTYYWCAQNNDGVATSAWTGMGTLILDTTGPTVSLSTPANNASVSDSTPTLTWSGSDATSGIAKYQLYVDSSLDTDNISSSATSTAPTNSLSCGAHSWYIRAYDNVDNYTDSSSFNLTMACGSGLPPSAYNPPSMPVPSEENPEGGFSVLINNNDEYTDNETVILKLYAGADTKRMAISNTEDFAGASQIDYQSEMKWELSGCHCEPQRSNPATTREESNVGIAASLCGAPRNDSICVVYVKFYTQYGVSSEVVNDNIILKTITTETETEEQPEDSDQEETVNPESDEEIPTEDNKLSLITFTKTLQFGSYGTEVVNLQNKLKELNFFPKEIESNNNFGLATEKAVKEYQTSKEIYPCGIVGPRTRKALNNEEFITNKDYQFTQDLKYNDQNEEVQELQTRLRDQNFFPYNIKSTGWFGSITQRAVNLFQKFYNLVQSGIVDEGMREVLNR